jgi:hypothetical protein
MDANAGIVQGMGEQRLESTMEEQEGEKEEKGKEEEEKGKEEEEKEGGGGEEEVKEKEGEEEEEEEEIRMVMSESEKRRVGGQGGDAKRPTTLVHLQAGLSMFGSTPRDRSSVRPSSSSSKARLLGLEYPEDTGHHTRANDFANAIALEDDERRGSDGPRRVKIRETQRAKSAGAFKYTRGGSPLGSGGCHVGDSLESHQPMDPWQGGAPSTRRALNIVATASTRQTAAQPSRMPKSPGRPATAQPCGGIVQPPPDPPPLQQQQQQQPCGGQGASFLPATLEVFGTHKQDWHSFHSPRQVQSARGRTLKSCATGNWHHREYAHFDQPDEAAGRGSPEVDMLNDDGTLVVWRQWKQSSSAVGHGAFSKNLRARPASGLLVSPSRPKTATVASLVVSSPRTRPAPPTTSRGLSARASPIAVRGKSAGPMQSKSSTSSSTSRIATSATSRIDTRATSATVRMGGQAVWDATTPGHRKLAHQSHARVTHGGRGREISLVPRHLDAPTGARVAEVSRYQRTRIGHHFGVAVGGAARGIEFFGPHQVLARDEIVASKIRMICDVEAQLGLV